MVRHAALKCTKSVHKLPNYPFRYYDMLSQTVELFREEMMLRLIRSLDGSRELASDLAQSFNIPY